MKGNLKVLVLKSTDISHGSLNVLNQQHFVSGCLACQAGQDHILLSKKSAHKLCGDTVNNLIAKVLCGILHGLYFAKNFLFEV
jgi:hypothetical protein